MDRLSGPDRNRVAAARTDLKDASVTERSFDRRLAAIRFPSAIETIATRLYTANEARAALTRAAAAVTTLKALRNSEAALSVSNRAVEVQVRAIRSALGLPPPSTS